MTNVPLNTYHWAVTTTKAVRSLTLLTGSRCHLYPNAPQVNDDLFVSGQGREGFPRLLVLINMHDAGRRNVCVCVTITCVYPAVTLYMITTGCAYVSITSGTLTHTSSWVFFFFSRLHNLLMALLPRPFVCAYRLNVLLFSFIYSCFP